MPESTCPDCFHLWTLHHETEGCQAEHLGWTGMEKYCFCPNGGPDA